MEDQMRGSWLRQQLEVARKEIEAWPEWKKQQLAEETERIPKKEQNPPGGARPAGADRAARG